MTAPIVDVAELRAYIHQARVEGERHLLQNGLLHAMCLAGQAFAMAHLLHSIEESAESQALYDEAQQLINRIRFSNAAIGASHAASN